MDVNKLRTLVFEKTGIKIDTSDPIFALVALNDAVLSESVDPHIDGLKHATSTLETQTRQLLDAADRVKKLLLQLGQVVEDTPVAGTSKQTNDTATARQSVLEWHWIAVSACISIITAILVLGGQAILGYGRESKPMVTTTATVKPAPGMSLTAEQIVLIQNGEKYAKMWPKLDAKTQAKIQALTQ